MSLALILIVALLLTVALHGRALVASSRLSAASPLPTPTGVVVATPTSDGPFDSPLPTPGDRDTLQAQVHLPTVMQSLRYIRYGWKGTAGGDVAAPNWYYYWETADPMPGSPNESTIPNQLALLEAGLAASATYVPMVWCTSDVKGDEIRGEFPTDEQIGELAHRYPGRAWLMFNEPDLNDKKAGCGGYLAADIRYTAWFSDSMASDWNALGAYLGAEYSKYYHSLKSHDPTARVFSVAPLLLPMPGFSDVTAPGGVPLWNAFLQAVQANGAALDGLVVHAYPNHVSTKHLPMCRPGDYFDVNCVQEALIDAYAFFQGSDGPPSKNILPALTREKTIWITETGVLAGKGAYSGGRPVTLERVREEYMQPMLNWLNGHIGPNGDARFYNGVAWYVTKDDKFPYTALQEADGDLTVVGETWRDATCPMCECPGPDCEGAG